MPVYGHFRVSGNRPGVYAGLAAAQCTLSSYLLVSRPFTGVLLAAMAGGPQAGLTNQRVRNIQPDVNVGPNTAFGGKGRKRPCKVRNAPAPAYSDAVRLYCKPGMTTRRNRSEGGKEGDRSMFSGGVETLIGANLPKNGPVPARPVNGYPLSGTDRRLDGKRGMR